MLEVSVSEAFDVFQRKLQPEKETVPRNRSVLQAVKARRKASEPSIVRHRTPELEIPQLCFALDCVHYFLKRSDSSL